MEGVFDPYFDSFSAAWLILADSVSALVPADAPAALPVPQSQCFLCSSFILLSYCFDNSGTSSCSLCLGAVMLPADTYLQCSETSCADDDIFI